MNFVVGCDDSIQKNVQEILGQLVGHFSQKIHTEVLADDNRSDITTGITLLSSKTKSPRDEQTQQQGHTGTPPIVQFWLDRLASIAFQSIIPANREKALIVDIHANNNCWDGITIAEKNEKRTTVICEWIRGYEELVRHYVFSTTSSGSVSSAVPIFDSRCVPILKNFELVLSRMVLKSKVADNENGSKVADAIPSSLLRAIKVLSTDISLLTVGANHDNKTSDRRANKGDVTNRLRTNIALPTLLRILGTTLEILADFDGNHANFKDENPRLECFGCLRLCAVTLLAFEQTDDKDYDSGIVAISAPATLSPHCLAPALSTSGDGHKKDLVVVQRILQRLESLKDDTPSESFADVRCCLNASLGADSASYDDTDDDYWNLLVSASNRSFSTTGWIDPNSDKANSTFQTVEDIWRSMEYLLTSLLNHDSQAEIQSNNNDIDSANTDDAKQDRKRRDFALKMLGGAGSLIRDVRAHFFLRDLNGMEDLSHKKSKYSDDAEDDDDADDDALAMSSVVVRMGRRVTNAKSTTPLDKTPSDRPIFETIPSRIATAVNALRLLLVPEMLDGTDACHKESLLEDIFPICAALMDSNNSLFGALGAAGFLRTIGVLRPRKMDPIVVHNVSEKNAGGTFYKRDEFLHSNAWTRFAEKTLVVLDRALQCSNHGHTIVAIGRAQSKLLEVMVLREGEKNDEERNRVVEGGTDDHFRRRRRITTERWLTNLERSLYRPTTNRQQLELLLGGVVPLLSQHAADETFESDGMEVGRLGLAALLPLTTNVITNLDESEQIERGNIGRKTQMASMVALTNLMFAAHPIMASHGGKIMSHLLATAAAAATVTDINDNERKSEKVDVKKGKKSPTTNAVRNMAILTAAISLVICGSKFAGEVIETIENDREQYEQELVRVVSEVRDAAAHLMAITEL
mmetsp:Transcript_117246/g.239893  ORF Transcript_117246/g.239893 Transcript_117246/m.239893 type:complete len:919 (+) Transcript_117246:201-2957(+)|eukprot:CAMPEP_0201181160 /NCGR_PEP_ID=MMETSP0851-20130426/118250_1 /ASSEMBLY_ACC=CAM_ASM_000631 /TAXON_ID=183588 /ORGANISM="Pseudo-nitzschia fraudulenta, Strain WWA7" /LENGTH=918 /DNA_ID=CAMNT_0047465499 /DNA_START=201 /DNA_END=2957 /DNA_ORIENTATION=-